MKKVLDLVVEFVKWLPLIFAGIGFILLLLGQLPRLFYQAIKRCKNSDIEDGGVFDFRLNQWPELIMLIVSGFICAIISFIFCAIVAAKKLVQKLINQVFVTRYGREQTAQVLKCKHCFDQQPYGVYCNEPNSYCELVHRTQPMVGCQTSYSTELERVARKTSLVYYL
ncbi:MAG: hypothetical protein COX77_04500 [Candidatus Komeilibacteria bacterium CG_4_10_14_0_2_um_filter_37_10]|uniref:Uncharacterized protein n=1 Tax=Candidatus Komeilibacteria bacterium CG_4_10_14_0_2_um_filter_37_10 TaxID=1974470 RepID=A0A2M7VDF5_9BACT|nr:MAG: hypothetical protein COX77_04500 [Candidatus Komeilibacteria bacterium CG_4_10_14_0_2_um_filter_37_10]PJA93011.1 MAG: hypothetical protein CO133_01450 [Candidatus Komeilibacteria bacterium CG_4_9_14_3_um_filter_37_5]